MGRHTFDAVWAAQPRRRSRRPWAVATGLGGLVVVLLISAITWLTSGLQDSPNNNAAATSVAPTVSIATTTSVPPAALRSTSPAVLPVTVLNNSAVNGLAARVAAVFEASGWPIRDLRNYTETRRPATTAFFTPGNAAEQAAAVALVAQFPQIAGGVEPRFPGLDGVGVTVTVVGDWLP